MKFGSFVFLDGRDDKEYALAQYVYSLDGVQAIPELRDIGKTVSDNIAQRMKGTSQPTSAEMN